MQVRVAVCLCSGLKVELVLCAVLWWLGQYCTNLLCIQFVSACMVLVKMSDSKFRDTCDIYSVALLQYWLVCILDPYA